MEDIDEVLTPLLVWCLFNHVNLLFKANKLTKEYLRILKYNFVCIYILDLNLTLNNKITW